jgi:hypothetical protein
VFGGGRDRLGAVVGQVPRLESLARLEGLDPIEASGLLLAVAPELDLRYERLFAFLNDDVTRRWPTVDLVLNLVCASLEEKLAYRRRFGPGGRLARSGLVRLVADPQQADPPLLAHFLRADEQVVQWLSGDRGLDARLHACCDLAAATGPTSPAIEEAIVAASASASAPLRLALTGSLAATRAAASLVAMRLSAPLLRAGLAEPQAASLARIVLRQAVISEAVLLLEDLDRVDGEPDRRAWQDALRRHPGAVIAAPVPGWLDVDFRPVALHRPDGPSTAAADAPGALGRAVRRIVPRYTWRDIVLPDDVVASLRELCDQATHQHTVMVHWGFDRKVRDGRNLTALFSGPPGTGKTMAAEVVARELGVDLYAIDLSQVLSKYIGETEKNLAGVFDHAERAGGVLFFDEADALFGKRSEVRDSHDRYANVEVSYLLQRMEDYAGVAILATNLHRHMDAAFVRRLKCSIEFPFPDAAVRRDIWRAHFPPSAPLAEDVDVPFLAERFALAGGSIRNVAVNAAFLAASAGGPIGMTHVVRAVRREYQKMGRPCTAEEFGPYHSLLAAARRA